MGFLRLHSHCVHTAAYQVLHLLSCNGEGVPLPGRYPTSGTPPCQTWPGGGTPPRIPPCLELARVPPPPQLDLAGTTPQQGYRGTRQAVGTPRPRLEGGTPPAGPDWDTPCGQTDGQTCQYITFPSYYVRGRQQIAVANRTV